MPDQEKDNRPDIPEAFWALAHRAFPGNSLAAEKHAAGIQAAAARVYGDTLSERADRLAVALDADESPEYEWVADALKLYAAATSPGSPVTPEEVDAEYDRLLERLDPARKASRLRLAILTLLLLGIGLSAFLLGRSHPQEVCATWVGKRGHYSVRGSIPALIGLNSSTGGEGATISPEPLRDVDPNDNTVPGLHVYACGVFE